MSEILSPVQWSWRSMSRSYGLFLLSFFQVSIDRSTLYLDGSMLEVCVLLFFVGGLAVPWRDVHIPSHPVHNSNNCQGAIKVTVHWQSRQDGYLNTFHWTSISHAVPAVSCLKTSASLRSKVFQVFFLRSRRIIINLYRCNLDISINYEYDIIYIYIYTRKEDVSKSLLWIIIGLISPDYH